MWMKTWWIVAVDASRRSGCTSVATKIFVFVRISNWRPGHSQNRLIFLVHFRMYADNCLLFQLRWAHRLHLIQFAQQKNFGTTEKWFEVWSNTQDSISSVVLLFSPSCRAHVNQCTDALTCTDQTRKKKNQCTASHRNCSSINEIRNRNQHESYWQMSSHETKRTNRCSFIFNSVALLLWLNISNERKGKTIFMVNKKP